MNVETQIKLNRFKPRSYQLPIMDALVNKGYRRILAILPRRAGKDITAFNLCIRECVRKVQVIYYVFPTYSQAKKVIWDSITNTGERILEYCPDELVDSKNSQEMKIRFKNGSLLQLVGSDNYDSLMGTNPQGVVFSEYALQDPRAYQYIRPILAANGGWAMFLSTPRGKNHLWELYQIALESPEWFCLKLTVEDTNHIPLSEIEKEKLEGIMSDDLIQQEYYTSFTMGVEGSYYAKYMDRMRVKGQIGIVPWETGFKVHSAWDIGVRDSTTIIMFQCIGQTVRIIDCYENSKQGLEHYIKVLEQKPYSWGKHIAPHDIAVQEFGSGMTRIEKAKQLGIKFTISNNVSIEDGIESVRSALSKIWIDEQACKPLIKALENYRQEYDVKRKIYKSQPLHDWSSHFCFTGDTLILTRSGMRPIMEIQDNDQVLTLKGWKQCNKAVLTKKNVQIVEVTFKDGTRVKCTPDHKFLTVNGWISAENLQAHTKIQSNLIDSPSIFADLYTGCGLANDTFQKVDQDFIEMFGLRHMKGVSPQTATYITKTIIPIIIHSIIWNAYLEKSIYGFQDQMVRDCQERREKLQQLGIDLMRADYGISAMPLDPLVGQNGNVKAENVSTVKRYMTALLELMDILKNSAIPIAKLPIIEKVEFLHELADVWDITVPKVGHFSLSNGAIVHNSDAMRYLCVSLPKTRDGLSPEELDKIYQDAMLGANSNMPSVFRTDLPDY